MLPKIAICIPSGRTWEAEMGLSLVSLVRETEAPIDVLWFMGSQISFQRNELVKRALDAEAEYLLWWDSDITTPPSALYELLGHHKDIVGATYLKKLPPFEMLGKIERADGRLKPATYLPGGCVLVKADVYRKIGWPYYFEEIVPAKLTWGQGVIASEDFSFCKKAIANGFEIWCDINLSQRVKHIGFQSVQMQLKEGHPDRVDTNAI
jgi:hypothetical protein